MPLSVYNALASISIQDFRDYLINQCGISYKNAWIHFLAKNMGLRAHGYGIHWSFLISYQPEAYSTVKQ